MSGEGNKNRAPKRELQEEGKEATSTSTTRSMKFQKLQCQTVDWRNSKQSMAEEMAHSFETGLYTDVSFKVGPSGCTINAHTAILMIRSEVFATMFSSRWTPADPEPDDNRRIVELPDQKPESFKNFIKYFYADKLPADTGFGFQEALDVLDLAHVYQVPGLITKCVEFIKGKINADSCVEIFERTRFYHERELPFLSFKFIYWNISSVVKTDQFLLLNAVILRDFLKGDIITTEEYEELDLFKALLRWGNVEGTVNNLDGEEEERKEVMMSLIPYIRFLLMSPEDFVKEVIPTKVLSDAQAFEIICEKINGKKNKTEQMELWSKPRRPLTDSDTDSSD